VWLSHRNCVKVLKDLIAASYQEFTDLTRQPYLKFQPIEVKWLRSTELNFAVDCKIIFTCSFLVTLTSRCCITELIFQLLSYMYFKPLNSNNNTTYEYFITFSFFFFFFFFFFFLTL